MVLTFPNLAISTQWSPWWNGRIWHYLIRLSQSEAVSSRSFLGILEQVICNWYHKGQRLVLAGIEAQRRFKFFSGRRLYPYGKSRRLVVQYDLLGKNRLYGLR